MRLNLLLTFVLAVSMAAVVSAEELPPHPLAAGGDQLAAMDYQEQVQDQGRSALVAWAALDNSLQPALVDVGITPFDREAEILTPISLLIQIHKNLPAETQRLVTSHGHYQTAMIRNFSIVNWLSRTLHPAGLDMPLQVTRIGEQRRHLMLYDPGNPALGGEHEPWPDTLKGAWINPPERLTIHDHVRRSMVGTPGDQRWLILIRPPRQWLAERAASIGLLQPFQSEIPMAELVTVATPAPHSAPQATAILAVGAPWLDRLEGYHHRLVGDSPALEEWEQVHLAALEKLFDEALLQVTEKQPSIDSSSRAESMALLRDYLQRGDPKALFADIERLRRTDRDQLTAEQLATDIGRQALQILIDVDWDRAALAEWSYAIPSEWRISRRAARRPWPDPAYVSAGGAFAPITELKQP